MKVKQQFNTVFIGVIPDVKNLAGISFRTVLAGMYHQAIAQTRLLLPFRK